MSTYSIYIMQLYDSIYNLMLVVWVLTVSYLFVAYMNHALLIASIPQAYGIFILNLRHSNLEATQGRRIKNYCSVKVVTNIFHPIRLLVFSDSYFLLLFYPSLVW